MVGLVWIICLPVWGRIGGTIIWGRIGGGGTIICQIYPKPCPPQLGNTGVDQFETQHSKGIKGTVLLLKRRYEEECAQFYLQLASRTNIISPIWMWPENTIHVFLKHELQLYGRSIWEDPSYRNIWICGPLFIVNIHWTIWLTKTDIKTRMTYIDDIKTRMTGAVCGQLLAISHYLRSSDALTTHNTYIWHTHNTYI